MSAMLTPAGLTHEAFLYSSDEEYVAALVPFLRDGLARGEGIVAAVGRRKWELLAAALGDDADDVLFVPDEEVYRTPVDALAAYDAVLRRFRDQGRTSVRAVGEVIYGATEHDHRRWLRYEPAAHHVFRDAPLHVICPYDQRIIPASVIQHARRTHPLLHQSDEARESPTFEAPEAVLRSLPQRLLYDDIPADLMLHVTDIAAARATCRRIAGRVLDEVRAEEAVLAIGEVIANGIRHGTGRIWLWLWARPETFACRVRNEGPPIGDVFAGYYPPGDQPVGGMGLWLVRRLADEALVRDGRNGPVVTMLFARQPR